ncbi:hypothetical protein J4407_01095 [Candidatus Pacearchaeota archaeon]|nr:hypothetical protein [Candidatus Pacearchaeota archaeon]
MTDFLFHKVSDEEKAEIQRQAKEIMDKFSERMSKVKAKISESLIERKDFEREEKKDIANAFPPNSRPDFAINNKIAKVKTLAHPEKNSHLKERNQAIHLKEKEDFRRRILENAPNKNKDFIIAEKKSWK